MTCDCEGFVDQYTHARGHYTVTVHEDDCPNHPENVASDYADYQIDMMKDERAYEQWRENNDH